MTEAAKCFLLRVQYFIPIVASGHHSSGNSLRARPRETLIASITRKIQASWLLYRGIRQRV
jgi:hypothetical protein